MTDAWVPWSFPFDTLGIGMGGRFHEDLSSANVSAANLGTVTFELRAKLHGLSGWSRIIARNRRFQRTAVRHLARLPDLRKPRVLFAYSYAALEPLRFARENGWRTILGQIDPGPGEERIVSRLHAENPGYAEKWSRPAKVYWQEWQAECELADVIAVNSEWSRSLLEKEGIPREKLRTLPLAFEPSEAASAFRRTYPANFTATRRLRVLFTGQINLRKGILPLLDAVRLLSQEPVEFWFVGPIQIAIPRDMMQRPKVRWIGPVPRNRTDDFYRQADVFVFPTFSDGFGLTQIEAQAWQLPIIASRFCGEVVEDGRNGLVLSELTGEEIANVIRRCLAEPFSLQEFAQNAIIPKNFGLKALGQCLPALCA